MALPFSLMVNTKYRYRYILLTSYAGNDTVVETAVYQAAQECLTLLSNRLGDSHYMFGRSVGLGFFC